MVRQPEKHKFTTHMQAFYPRNLAVLHPLHGNRRRWLVQLHICMNSGLTMHPCTLSFDWYVRLSNTVCGFVCLRHLLLCRDGCYVCTPIYFWNTNESIFMLTRTNSNFNVRIQIFMCINALLQTCICPISTCVSRCLLWTAKHKLG